MEIDIPKDIRAFMDETVDSFAMWDLLIFCAGKTGETQTADQVALMLGRPLDQMKPPIQKLKELGLVTAVPGPSGEEACRLDLSSPKFPLLKRFWDYNETQENRLRILSYLLQKRTR
jgi:hypothetical protein